MRGRFPTGWPQFRVYFCQFWELWSRIPNLVLYTFGAKWMRVCKFKERTLDVTSWPRRRRRVLCTTDWRHRLKVLLDRIRFARCDAIPWAGIHLSASSASIGPSEMGPPGNVGGWSRSDRGSRGSTWLDSASKTVHFEVCFNLSCFSSSGSPCSRHCSIPISKSTYVPWPWCFLLPRKILYFSELNHFLRSLTVCLLCLNECRC